MKKGKLIALPAKPVAEDSILWSVAVSRDLREEELTIECRPCADKPLWIVGIKAHTFEAVEAMMELASRRLGVLANSPCKAQRFRANSNAWKELITQYERRHGPGGPHFPVH